MSINVYPEKSQFDVMNTLLASIATKRGRFSVNNYAELQRYVRMGIVDKLISIGDQIEVNKSSSVTIAITTGAALSGATVTFQTFLNKVGTIPAGTYVFSYNDGAWYYNGNAVTLSAYGISVSGTAANGDILTVTVNGIKLVFDVLGIDYDTPSSVHHTHSLSLGAHNIVSYGSCPFDAAEALYYVDAAQWADGLPAGTYNVTLYYGTYGNTTAEDGTYQFTTTQVVPVGGTIRHSTMGAWREDGYSKAKITAGTFTTYGTDYVTIESGLTTTEGAEGTSLGTTTARTPANKSSVNLNFTERNAYGSNKYSESAMRQWINSTAASGWWSSKNKFDRPATSPAAGFLYGVDPDFLAVIGAVKKRTGLNVADGGNYVDTDETVFLQSMTEIGFGVNSTGTSTYETSMGTDNTIIRTAYPYWTNATNADRIKYEGSTARVWWLRSPGPSDAGYERHVSTSGALSNVSAYRAHGAVPGLCII